MYGTERQNSEQHHGHEFMVGLFCGAAIGAAIGLLLAPKSGAELRHQLAYSADRIRERASDTYGRASHAMHEAVARGREVVDRAATKGREAFEEAKQRGADATRPRPEGVDVGRSTFTS